YLRLLFNLKLVTKTRYSERIKANSLKIKDLP
ncbi:hypothetical protein LCGC14_3151290, partial [marine sediment metagenome]